MSLIKGTWRQQGERLIERSKVARQEAQDLRVDAIAAGDTETEFVCKQAIKFHDKNITAVERSLAETQQ